MVYAVVFIDIHIHRLDMLAATKFLILQCKKTGTETRSAVWREAVAQLNRYLSGTHRTRRSANRSPVYGITSLGLTMRVYKYDDDSRSVEDWAPPGLNPGDYYNLKTQALQVQQILDYIYNNH